MKLSVSLFFLLVGLFMNSAAKAQVPLFDEPGRSYQRNQWDLQLQTSYYEATANYTKDGGQYNSLPSGYKYNLLNFDFGIRWVPVNNWGFYASSQVANATSENLINVRKNSSLSHAVIGTDFVLASWKKFELAPDFSILFPFERIDPTEDIVLNQEGAVQMTGRLLARAQFGSFHPFGFAGVTHRDEGRSTLLPYGLGAELQFSRWSLGGELRGSQTILNDQYTDEPFKREVVAAKNGGAMKFYAIDPSLLETNFWLKKKIGSHWGFKLGGGTSVTGANTSAGWNVLAGLNYSFETSRRSRSTPVSQPPEDHPDFQEETNDGVNQELFEAPPPPAPAQPPAVPTVRGEKKKLQNELNQTEFQIELKSTKKKKKTN